jgi:hypothetical protein
MSKPANLQPVVETLDANIRYLQDEFAALLVKGRFDQTTAQYFRSLQRNNSAFDSQSLQNVRIAAELSSVSKPNTTASYSSTCRGNRSYYSRGSYFGNQGGRGQFFGQRDSFHTLRGPSYPRFRAPGDNFNYRQSEDQN